MERMRADIEEVTSLTVMMGELALSMLERSVESLPNHDKEFVLNMKEDYERIERLDHNIEEKAFRILMIYQPMSRDMRLVATILKMITYLERIGKYGYKISKCSADLDTVDEDLFANIKEMGFISIKMIRGTLDSLKTGNTLELLSYGIMESRLDELRRDTQRESLESMRFDSNKTDEGNSCIAVSRYFERAGDYACKLAEKIIFMISGEYVVFIQE
jgi:phosphate transport system regulatory protein PhoU